MENYGLCKGIITKLERYVENKEIDCLTKKIVKHKMEVLERNYEKFVVLSDKLLEEEIISEEKYEIETKLYSEKYQTIKTVLSELFEVSTSTPNDNLTESDNDEDIKMVLRKQTDILERLCNGTANSNSINLPKISIKLFSGEYHEWSSFRDMFISSIKENTRLSDVEKLYYLKSLVRGDAEKIIKNLSVTEQNFEIAWNLLSNRYENEKAIMNSLINRFNSFKKLSDAKHGLKRFSSDFDEILSALNSMGEYGNSRDPWIINRALSMLDGETVELWARYSIEISKPTCEDLQGFLRKRYQEIDISRSSFNGNPRATNDRSSKVLSTVNTGCYHCLGNHCIANCPQLLRKSIEERIAAISKNRLCFNCLRKGHMASSCTMRKCCEKCRGKHHTLIHNEKFHSKKPGETHGVQAETNIKCVEASNVLQSNHSTSSGASILLPTAEVSIRCCDGEIIKCRALMDVGSQVNLVSESLLSRIGANRTNARKLLRGVSSGTTEETRGQSRITILSRIDEGKEYQLDVLILKKLIGQFPVADVTVSEIKSLKKWDLADEEFYRSRDVDLLIGVNGYCQFTKAGKNFVTTDKLWMLNSIFGWLVCGGRDEQEFKSNLVNVTAIEDVDKQLEKFWHMDDLESNGDIQNVQKIQDVERNSDGRYFVHLSFINDPPVLGDSFINAMNQFQAIERRLAKDENFRHLYRIFMREYLELGHMRRLTSYEVSREEPCYYLPHHGIMQRSNGGQKIRVVFNASAKTSNGRSLNDELNPGPNLQSHIVDILTWFRESRYVFMTDIKKMYRQIRIHADHERFMRILWRENTDVPLEHFCLLTVTYGTNCAPFDALRVMRQLAEDESQCYPKAAELLSKRRYMDDLFGGSNDIEEARALRDELIQLLRCGGFELSKWASNIKTLIDDLPPEDCLLDQGRQLKDSDTVKTLGVFWYPSSDEYSFRIDLGSETSLTKRTFLSEMSRIFDPLGWLSPVTTRIKMIMQNVWLNQLDWDEVLPHDLQEDWREIRNELSSLESVRISRWLGAGDRMELHGFSDASKRAYGAVIYSKIFDNEGNFTISLLVAKSKICPLKTITIPKLELAAATMLSELMKRFEKLFVTRKPLVKCWSDSQVVLCWIENPPKDKNVFVNNRVSKIILNYPRKYWGYINTKQNPADLISRGKGPNELIASSLWWNGPDILRIPCDHNNEEQANVSCNALIETFEFKFSDIVKRFSSLAKLKKTILYILRFGTTKRNSLPKEINLDELNQSLRLILRMTQKELLPSEYKKCAKQETVSRTSVLYFLNPYLDEYGLLRVGGRLCNADLSDIEKHPVILPNCLLSTLILRDIHNSNMHCGIRQMVSASRQRFWIIGVNQLARKEFRECVRCRRFNGDTFKPAISPLPSYRVREAKAFCRTGVDYAGPFGLRAFRSRGNLTTNGFVAVFVCMATKAVHFEVVLSLDRNSFVAAFERFLARRGNCLELWSDNGKNFRGTCRFLAELYQWLQQSDINDFVKDTLTKRNAKWSFIPPYAPHFGGLWEAAVRVMKSHLKKVVGTQVMTVEEFSTILCRIEMIMNSRPLSSVTDDPNDLTAITPSHFITGEPICPLLINEEHKNLDLRLRLKMIQDATSRFWRLWHGEYLRSLISSSRWVGNGREPKAGELVLIKRANLQPGCWKMARVTRLIHGTDDVVRVAEVRDEHGIRTEAVRNLVPLELKTESSTGEYVRDACEKCTI